MSDYVLVAVHFFPGCSYSHLDADTEFEIRACNYAEDVPQDEIRVDDYCGLLCSHFDYSDYLTRVGKAYADSLNLSLTEKLGFDAGVTFESTSSPRYYNFETDRLFVNIPLNTMEAMRSAGKGEPLAEVLGYRAKSRSGFTSFYDHDSASLSGDLTELDHNEAGFIFDAGIKGLGVDLDSVADLLIEGLWEDVYSSIDWENLDPDLATQECENWLTWHDESPSAALAWLDKRDWRGDVNRERFAKADSDTLARFDAVLSGEEPPTLRCEHTRDMFTGKFG